MKKLLILLVLVHIGGSAARAQQLYTNGPIATGATSKSGVDAPTGTQWSELQNDAGNTTVSNTNPGFSANKSAGAELADDFVVPAGRRWIITSALFPGYQTNAAPASTIFAELTVRIWNGQPGLAASQVVFGENIINRLSASTDAMTFRIGNSLYPFPSPPGTTRKVWNATANFSTPIVLQPGSYWISWSTNVTANAPHFFPAVTIVNSRTVPNANAIQLIGGRWEPLADTGTPAGSAAVSVALPFVLNGTTALATRAGQTGPDGLSLQVGPVPATDAVQAYIANLPTGGKLLLSDALGRVVWQGTAAAGTAETAVPLSGIAPGVYSLELRSAKGSVFAQVVEN